MMYDCVTGVRTATSPRDAIVQFYAAQNAGDTEQIVALMAEDVEYHDMVSPSCVVDNSAVLTCPPLAFALLPTVIVLVGQVHSDPFRGRDEVEAYFRKVSPRHALLVLYFLPRVVAVAAAIVLGCLRQRSAC